MSKSMQSTIRGRRKKRIIEDVALLKEAITGAPIKDPSDSEMRAIYAEIKKGRNDRAKAV